MNRMMNCAVGMSVGVLLAAVASAATPATLSVDVNKPGITIPAGFNGLMTEEINHAFDGGLYAELIRNRSFLDNKNKPVDWSIVGDDGGAISMSLDTTNPMNSANPVSLRLDLKNAAATDGVANTGFWGIPVKPSTTYTTSFYARAGNGISGALTVAIVSDDGKTSFAQAQTGPLTGVWAKYLLTLTTPADAPASASNKFVIYAPAKSTGSVWLSMVSLFPPTYKDAPNGLRPDLMKLMANMQPAFLRMPGGNYLEGNDFPNRFNWKAMIGPVASRKGHMSCWGYRSSDGFGLPEFLTWCEQLHMQPVLAVFDGYTLNHDYVPAGPKLQPYVASALEEIQYVTGDVNTKWGKQRAEDGHPQPFKLTYVEIGNEDWSKSYNSRFAQFYDAIKAKYPKLQIIATSSVTSRTPDVIDDHYYRAPSVMASDMHHYDKTNRTGPKIFVGEWASMQGKPTPDLNAALGDSAWLMGLENDSDVVVMQAYAPLLVNVNHGAWQWPTNLIGYNAIDSFGSVSYWAQCMLNQNMGDVVLPTDVAVHPQMAATAPVPHGAIGVGTWHTQAQYKDIKVTSPDGKTLLTADLSKSTKGWTINGGKWNTQDLAIEQSLTNAETWATIGNPKWTNYTLTLKARKLSGKEGFLILFRVQNANNYLWWNLGGWGNSHSGLQASDGGSRVDFGPTSHIKIATNRWYDIKIQVHGHDIKCYLDGKLVTHTTENPFEVSTPLYGSATYDKSAGQVILKVVNMSSDNIDGAVDLRGAKNVSPDGSEILLDGKSPKATNTIDDPTNILPQKLPLTGAAAKFHHMFPPYSLSILRIKAAAE